jgi:hypothetical protein
MTDKRKKILLFVGIALYFILYFSSGLLNLQHAKTNVFDYGIYQQALFDIAAGISFNPYISVRDIFVFNEHFDPIVIAVSPLISILGYQYWSPFVIEWLFILISTFFVMYVIRDEKINIQMTSLGFLLLPRFFLTGILYPIHPVTWAMFPLILMTYTLVKQRYFLAFLSASALFFFKESFCFGLVGLSFYFLFIKEFRYFALYFLTSVGMVIFEMKLRNELLGGIISYGNSYAASIINNPIDTFKTMLNTFFSDSFIKGIACYIIPFFFLIKEKPPLKRPHLYAPLFYLFPLFLIHLIIERYSFHHSAKFATVLSGVLIFSGAFSILLQKKKAFIILSFAALILTSMSSIKRFFGPIYNRAYETEGVSSIVKTDLKNIRSIIKSSYQNGDKVYATGGTALHIMKPGMDIYHHQTSKKQEIYQIIVLEKNGIGDPWPLSYDQVKKIQRECAPYAREELMNNSRFYVARGQFPVSCIYSRTSL